MERSRTASGTGAVIALGMALAGLAAPAELGAQVPVTPVGMADRPVPPVEILGAHSVMALAQWPGISMKVNEESHVVMFAVTRGREDLPIQVLSPRRPGLDTRIRGGRTLQARGLNRRELLHLVNFGEAPLIVAFASRSKPDLEQFRFGPDWAPDLLLDTLVSTQEEMLTVLGRSIFGEHEDFSVAVATAPNPTPISRYAEAWHFENSCAGQASYYRRRSGLGWMGNSYGGLDLATLYAFGGPIYDASAFSWGLGLGASPTPWIFGSMYSLVAPVLRGGVNCTNYLIAWAPIAPQLPPPRTPLIPADTTTLPSDTARVPIPAAVRIAADDARSTEPAITAASPTFQPSAWRRGETGSARRFPAVMTEERPWTASRALPVRPSRSEFTDELFRQGARRGEGLSERPSNADRSPAASDAGGGRGGRWARGGDDSRRGENAARPRAESPTRGREMPVREPRSSDREPRRPADGARPVPAEFPGRAPTPAPTPAPRSDGSIIPVPPNGQRGASGTPGGGI